MLDPTEVLDLQHCRKQYPLWAEKKAGHCFADAAACDTRAAEAYTAARNTAIADHVERNIAYSESMKAMAKRYRARARILMGEEL